jgi:hypothetical protein
MTARLIAAWPLERYQLWLAYADGTEGAVDLENQLAPWSLEPLRDVLEFRRLTLDRTQNLLVWPSGVDLDTSALYRELKLRKRRKRAGFL